MKRMLGAALILGCTAATNAQPGASFIPPTPSYEQFVHGTNLRIRLTMRQTSLTALEDPGFTAVFENTGVEPLYLNPHVVSNLRLFDERGNLMRPSCVDISEPLGPVIIQRSELLRLAAGETWVKPLAPEFAPGRPDSVMRYRGCGREQDRLLLPAGRYTARFTYLNYAGYTPGYVPGQPAGYDLRDAADVWEGRIDSDPVAFTITASDTESPPACATCLATPHAGGTSTFDATSGPWPDMARDFAINCAARWPEWWFAANPVSATGLCGTADAFGKLRAMLDSPDEDIRLAADTALISLTFVGEEGSPELAAPTSPAAWDLWHLGRRDESRAEWAARRLLDTAVHPLQREAADYLSGLKDRRWLPALRAAAAVHPSAWVRISAARGVAEFDRAEAIAFVARELNHRDLWICVAALQALNSLTGQSLVFDFMVPSERKRAIEAFAARGDAVGVSTAETEASAA